MKLDNLIQDREKLLTELAKYFNHINCVTAQFLGGSVILSTCFLLKLTSSSPKYDISVFSWHNEQLQRPHETFELLERHAVDAVFQYLSLDHSVAEATHFIEKAADFKKDIYFLTGEPEWALDPTATELIEWIKQIGHYQDNQTSRESLKGIVLDVEPFLLAEYKQDPQAVMTTYVASMQAAYKAAKVYQLEVIVCVPYYFDTLGFTEELESITRDASDKLAVMNYYRGKEMEHLQTENEISHRYNKTIINIYELQPPGQHDLTDQNTYYNYGIHAAYDNFQQLKRFFSHQRIELAFHEFEYFKKLSEKQ